MLKLRNAIALSAPLADFARVESALAHILGVIFDEECVLTYQADVETFAHDRPWLVCRHESCTEIGLCIEVEGIKSSRGEFFSQLIRLAKYLHESQPRAFSIARQWSDLPAEQHAFEVTTTAGSCAHVLLASSQIDIVPALLARGGALDSPRPMPLSRCNLEVLVQRLVLPGEFTLRADARVFLPGAEAAFEARMSRAGDKIQMFFEKEECLMSTTADAACTVTLSLGAIELSLGDLMQLRPGMCIEFDAPECFDGMLVVNGAPWLEARVVLEDRVLKVTLQDAAGSANGVDILGAQETSAEKLRLVG